MLINALHAPEAATRDDCSLQAIRSSDILRWSRNDDSLFRGERRRNEMRREGQRADDERAEREAMELMWAHGVFSWMIDHMRVAAIK